jgi:hypothetical protein
MKIIKRICFVIILAGILLGAMILVPFYKHVNTRYAVTIYDFNSNEELQYMEARVSGEYEYFGNCNRGKKPTEKRKNCYYAAGWDLLCVI